MTPTMYYSDSEGLLEQLGGVVKLLSTYVIKLIDRSVGKFEA